MDGIQSVSARDAILREIISNSLAHRDFSNAYIAKMVIGRDEIFVENGNRAHGIGALSLNTFKPFPKNPPISKVFREIGFADELGSGMRNSYKYTKLYSGADPKFIEGDVFEIHIPLSTGALTKVGPGTQAGYASSTQAGTHVSTQAGYASSTQAGTQTEDPAITISLDIKRMNELLDFCDEPRTRDEMQGFCGIKTREYFRKKILVPLIRLEKIFLTIPDKPKSPNQKYTSRKK